MKVLHHQLREKGTLFGKKLWKLNIPPRVKHFLWRAYRGTLATGLNVQKRVKKLATECFRCKAPIWKLWAWNKSKT